MAAKQIPYVNLKVQHQFLRTELSEAVARVLDGGQFVLGDEVLAFERRFADLCDMHFAVAVNSGLDALVLALRGIGVRPGDEVITVPNSFMASTSCIILVGAKPVFVDVRDDYNIDPAQIERVIGPRTKAIIPVHLTGRPADMGAICEIARQHGLFVIEDAAQAVLAEYRGTRVGSLGTVGCFSLHPLKTLNACGDGGILTTDDEDLYLDLKLLRNHGFINRDRCIAWGLNSRLDTMQAAILLTKMKYLEAWTKRRQANARYYQERLKDLPGIQVPTDHQDERAVYHTFVIQSELRDELKQFLQEKGIGTAIHYPIPIHLQVAAQELGYGVGSFPQTESQADKILSLPVYPELTQSDLDYVADQIDVFCQGRN